MKYFNKIKFNHLFFVFINLIFVLAIFYLYRKHQVGNDSTISEWMINYQGGFTRRGLIGEVCYQLAIILELELRYVIFLFQSILYFFFSILLLIYLKNFKINWLIIFALFSPLFLLYPIAEIEVIARKEIFLYVGFIIFLQLSSVHYSKNSSLIYIFFVYPILCLIWEPFILFVFFSLFIIIVNNKKDTLNKLFFKGLFSFSSTIVVVIIIIFKKFDLTQHQLMAESLMLSFNENCYMSCALLATKTTIYSQFQSVFALLTVEVIFRYSLIICIGFFPLALLSFNTKLKDKILFLPNNLLMILLILLSPSLILFLSGTDWGRWSNICYVFSILTFFYLLKNNFIKYNKNFIFFDKLYIKNKKKFIVFFIIFAFMWNPKTGMTGDVATNSLYKVTYNTSKIIFKFEGVRLFQNSPIIKFHKRYIE